MYMFVDTEFDCLEDGTSLLLSVGLSGPRGEEFYAEHDVHSSGEHNSFLVDHVLPQLGHGLGFRGSLPQIGGHLVAWLRQFTGEVIELCYDYHSDREAFEALLIAADAGRTVRFEACHVGYLLGDQAAHHAAEICWQELARSRGLRRHHALADALALRARFESVHHIQP